MSVFIAASALKLMGLRAKTCRHEEVQETGNTVILIYLLAIQIDVLTGSSIRKKERKTHEIKFREWSARG